MKNSKNVHHYLFGSGARHELLDIIAGHGIEILGSSIAYFIDHYFEDSSLVESLPIRDCDFVCYVDTTDEPKTEDVDSYIKELKVHSKENPVAIVGFGGGSTLDVAKAVSNLCNNPGKAEDYQGWDLVKNPGVFKIGIPTLSGTGAEASRTCVMTNKRTGLKLGMNSDYTIYDQLILDPELTKSVPDNQYFYSGMDSYIHCIESLEGSYRHPIGDAFSHQSLDLVRKVFLSNDMKSVPNRADLMIASYLGGCAVANSFVGIVHPVSAGLSVVLGIHHCEANCLALAALDEFYPKQVEEFHKMREKQGIKLRKGLCADLSEEIYEKLYQSTIIHEKPLQNALGADFKNILTLEKVSSIFKKI